VLEGVGGLVVETWNDVVLEDRHYIHYLSKLRTQCIDCITEQKILGS
jgi:hypothetical protein